MWWQVQCPATASLNSSTYNCTAQTLFWCPKTLSGFTTGAHWKVSIDEDILAADLIAHVRTQGSFSDHKTWAQKVFKWIMRCDLIRFAVVNVHAICVWQVSATKHRKDFRLLGLIFSLHNIIDVLVKVWVDLKGRDHDPVLICALLHRFPWSLLKWTDWCIGVH